MVKRELTLVTLGFTLAVILFTVSPSLTGYFTLQSATCENPKLTAFTSPGAGKFIIPLIDEAQNEVKIEMYVFTSKDVINALKRAVKRRVKVEVILEPRVKQNFATAQELKLAGVKVKWASTTFTNTHSKLIIIDGKSTVIGSINLSMHALELNRETAVVINDPCTAQMFSKTFQEDWTLSSNVK